MTGETHYGAIFRAAHCAKAASGEAASGARQPAARCRQDVRITVEVRVTVETPQKTARQPAARGSQRRDVDRRFT